LFQVPVEDLQSRTRRNASAALARQVAMYVCHVSLGLSFSDVGALFGRDRTTASHACKVIEERRDDRGFDEFMKRVEEAVNALGATPPPRVPAFGCGA
jgi:chromosomal replication initiation ATPase DnaA